MKVKHNKKRNTAFLYEVLVKELTQAIVDKEPRKKKFISNLIKESFGARAVLGRELALYKTLLETTGLELHLAEKLLHETKREYGQLNSRHIFDAQTRVINKINKTLSKEAWSTFVPSFKSLATVDAIFNSAVSPKQRVLHEDVVVNMMHSAQKLEEQKLEPIDNIVYNSFVKKFNEQYGELLQEQKELLGKYIASFTDNGLELKLYLNEELGRLKKIINSSLLMEEVLSDDNMLKNTKKVLTLLESFKKVAPSREIISTVLKAQTLVQEIQSDD